MVRNMCLICLRAELLQAENAGADLVAPTLPSLKFLIDEAFRNRAKDDTVLPRVMHGLLSAALQNVDDMR
jgi:hypothetical protein